MRASRGDIKPELDDDNPVVETIPVYFNRPPDDGGEMVLIQVRKPRGKRARDAREASERAIDGD